MVWILLRTLHLRVLLLLPLRNSSRVSHLVSLSARMRMIFPKPRHELLNQMTSLPSVNSSKKRWWQRRTLQTNGFLFFMTSEKPFKMKMAERVSLSFQLFFFFLSCSPLLPSNPFSSLLPAFPHILLSTLRWSSQRTYNSHGLLSYSCFHLYILFHNSSRWWRL